MPRPEPPKPPPPPRPAPPPDDLPRSWSEANYYPDRLADEKTYHEASWGRASGEWLKAVGETPPLDAVVRLPGKGAFYKRSEDLINMGGKVPDTKFGQAVWRHEFGHHMDHASGMTKQYSTYHEETKFASARRADAKRLSRHLGQTVDETRAKVKKFDREAKAIAEEVSPAKRRAALEKMATKAGIDLDEATDFLTDQGPFGYTGEFSLGEHSKDAITWRFLKAWEQRDVQGVIDILVVNPKVLSSYSGAWKNQLIGIQQWAYKETGVLQMFSDYMDALTTGRAGSNWKHSAKYYADRVFRGKDLGGHAEIFANVVSVSGSGPIGEKMLAHFSPAIYKRVRETVAKMGFRGRRHQKAAGRKLPPKKPKPPPPL